ncbi:RNA-binding protein 26-like [Pollicipes pollicipes]|uniref:RNA-binding protein 26-like n=1 Tax=Pollicipes pollicipes TaxID=41117 RepID=UPI001884DD33|nr:RNA-binding protein 26-like [Pollicipes pollicipes]
MIVEKPEVLKQWMADTLEPLCDAEPTKLARYVLALIRKEISPERLRASMLDNLDVFLHERASQFVERLLAALETRSYEGRTDGRVVTRPAPPAPRRQVLLPDHDDSCAQRSPCPERHNRRRAGSASPPRPGPAARLVRVFPPPPAAQLGTGG